MLLGSPRNGTRAGFALIATISLMVLMALVAIGLLSLASVTVRSGTKERNHAIARANARLALIIAIGELQTQLGPDRRIALPSHEGLIGSAPASGASRYLSVHNPYPDNGSERQEDVPWDQRAQDSFETWLVSGPKTERDKPSFPGSKPTGPVVTFTPASILEEDSVVVPTTPVNLATADSGSMAWWIDDLGQKASLLNTRGSEDSLRHVIPDQILLSRALDDGSLSWFPDSPDDPARSRLFSRSTAEIVGPEQKLLAYEERWLGGTHYGLLVDSHRGALRKDLSVALSSDLPTLTKNLGERIFPAIKPSLSDPGGPEWAQLHSFYELASQTGPLPVRAQTEQQMGVYPLIAGFVEMFGISNTLGYSPAAHPDYFSASWFNYQGGGAPNYVMTVHMAPVIKLWNPYSRPLEASDYTLVVGNSDYQYEDGNHSVETKMIWSGVRPSQLPAGMRFEHRYHIPSTTFAPGEVKLFSLQENTFLDMFNGKYRPQTGRSVGKKTNVTGKGFVLGKLTEGPFTGHSFWDMHCTKPDLTEYDANNLNYVSGRATGGWTQRQGNIATDGGDVVISDSANSSKQFSVSTGSLITWSLQLFQGLVPKGESSLSQRPLVSIKNINTSTRTPSKSHPNIPELNKPATDPYFAGNRHLDATWARRISLHQLVNQGDRDRRLYNPANHPTKDTRWLADFNPRSPTIGCWPEEYAQKPSRRSFYPGGPLLIDGKAVGASGYGLGTPGNYLTGTITNPTDKAALELNTFIGYSDEGGTSQCVLFEIPEPEFSEQLFHSVGQLRHANLTIENGDYHTQLQDRFGAEDWFSDNLHPAYPIGASRADPRLQLDQDSGRQRELTITDGSGSHTSTHYDLSWHLNEHLWDSYFFSAPEDANRSHNPRLVLRPGQTIDTGKDGILDNASALMLQGSFNIHSTSIEAWRSFLMATLGAEVTGESDEEERIPISRFIRPLAGMVTERSLPEDPENYLGYRSLSEEEAGELAILIVEEIKERGPFFSLADFVNRATIDTAPLEHQLKGALQAAIDKTEINAAFTEGKNAIKSNQVGKIYEAEAFAGDIAAAVPGYLEQGDILARMGHLLTVRSDTFVIRAYGSSLHPDGSVAAKAWCEATVQRLPSYLDLQDAPEVAFKDLTSSSNENFGRRFVITSFRWIPADELQS